MHLYIGIITKPLYVIFTIRVAVLYQRIQTRMLCTSICVHSCRTDTNIVNYLQNDLKLPFFEITFQKIDVKSLNNYEKVYVIRTILYQFIWTLIKHAFLFNFLREQDACSGVQSACNNKIQAYNAHLRQVRWQVLITGCG